MEWNILIRIVIVVPHRGNVHRYSRQTTIIKTQIKWYYGFEFKLQAHINKINIKLVTNGE